MIPFFPSVAESIEKVAAGCPLLLPRLPFNEFVPPVSNAWEAMLVHNSVDAIPGMDETPKRSW
jgi:hypothetical protein